MINYTEKGSGLHDAIRAAGHFLRLENGAWVSSNDAAVQAIIDGYLLTDAKTYMANQIDSCATRLRAKATKDLSAGEMAEWAIKKVEADKVSLSGNAADAPNLSLEAQQRGITLSSLVTKVQANADAVNQREAKIAGIAGKHKDAMRALNSFDAVGSYDYSPGWPVV